jgi:Ca2+/Na+ antiporter
MIELAYISYILFGLGMSSAIVAYSKEHTLFDVNLAAKLWIAVIFGLFWPLFLGYAVTEALLREDAE